MTWFTESPFILTAIALITCVALIAIYFNTQERRIIPFVFLAALFAVAPVVADTLVETDREQVKRKVYEMARCVRMNDVDGLLRYVDQSDSPEANYCRARIKGEMPTYTFRGCNVTRFREIKIEHPEPGKATVEFLVFVDVDAPNFSHKGMAPRAVGLTFVKDAEGEYKVCHLDHFHSSKNYNPNSPLRNHY